MRHRTSSLAPGAPAVDPAADRASGTTGGPGATGGSTPEDPSLFRLFVEHAFDLITMVDVEGHVRYASPSHRHTLGYEPDDLVGRLVFEFVHPEDLETIAGAIAGSASGRRIAVPPVRLLHRDGSWRIIEWVGVPVPEEHAGQLLMAIGRDLTERTRVEDQLARSLAELRSVDAERRELLARLVDAQERERERISADIHDDSVQVMAAAAMRLQVLRRGATEQELPIIDRTEQTIAEAIERLRRLVFRLRPRALRSEGLGAAIRAYATEAAREEGPPVQVTDRMQREPPEAVRIIAYRIVQEALANVRRHAAARRASVDLSTPDGSLLVRVADDGRGFDPSADGGRPDHLGIPAMRERAHLAGGWCRVESRPGGGTVVEFALPIERPPAA